MIKAIESTYNSQYAKKYYSNGAQCAGCMVYYNRQPRPYCPVCGESDHKKL